MSARILNLTGTSHPKAEIVSVNAAAGSCVFAWLDMDGARVDSGGSVARFAPSDTDPSDEFLAAVIADPLPSTPQVVFTFTEFRDRCEARVSGLPDRIYAAAADSIEVRQWLDVAVSRNAVHLDGPELTDAFAAFIAAGLMTEVERDAILAP